ncbi:NAD(+) diphosphatase [Microbacterium sp. ANT_H45B]|uniref:NAD(+) diphosphatase n=1 Tax=Microbacterium TaxID=33882 RepID=UPI0011ECBF42|nr:MULTISPECIES: NAD(+) diphosphatase [Microbacterium]KAA0961419.1 NAD(+) diphosphatase [Microbacterium sp. ANT_H45B]MCP1429466.1 NAD+ diphosphatase [Microbacterium foliorum]
MTMKTTSLDRAADLRGEPGLIDRLRADRTTRVIATRGGRVRIADGDVDHAALLRVPAEEIVDATWALLGRDTDGHAILLAVLPPEPETESVDTAPDEMWLGLRDLGARLAADETELLIEALALGGWLRDAPFCPSCGGGTELRQAGWSRHCLVCGREHFPRTDPAVIVAVESADGERLLLGANANWGGRMYSCFAGFTEAGESLEATVHRELEEESGVRLASLRYVSSQPWPFPRSLMLGFRAVVLDEGDVRPDGEEIIDARWFTRAEIGSALAGDGPVGLPGPSSIARALIVSWFEERA